MEFRFRYLDAASEEIEVSSLDGLRALMQSGTVREDTLLHDALTLEWAPARAHSVFRFLRDELARARPGDRPSEVLELGMTLSLQDMPDAADPADAVRALLRERAEDRPDERLLGGMLVSTRSSASASARTAEPAPAPESSEPPRSDADPAPAPLLFTSPVPKIVRSPKRPAARLRELAPVSAAPSASAFTGFASLRERLRIERVHTLLDRLGRAMLRVGGPRALPASLALAGLVGLLVVLVSQMRDDDGGIAAGAPQAAAMAVSADIGRLVSRMAPAQASAFQRMVTGVDSLRALHGIGEVPRSWLEGAYLADAPRFPEVRDYWTRYRAFLKDIRASDRALYRAGFVRSLDEQGVDGSVRSLRIAQAMKEFERTQPQREGVYGHMDELSATALELHALLVDRAPDISYEPALQGRVSREPVVEALAEDSVLGDQMWTLLERIFASLEWVGGEAGGSRDNVTERLLQGIEASAR